LTAACFYNRIHGDTFPNTFDKPLINQPGN
jgi:hypothetical protein